jgi:lipopolysaccharide/colanic/teichoic acid biosynthesis glycosyltransferase
MTAADMTSGMTSGRNAQALPPVGTAPLGTIALVTRPVAVTAGIGPGRARRCLDVLAAGLGLLVTGLPLLAAMAAIKLTSRGPALFRQVRLGQGGRPFLMYKLRTMRIGMAGPEVTATADPRITRLGRILRRLSVDELPQLWNVLRGDMTLVGPRPETPGLASLYPDHCRWVFRYRPGLTGPAQVRFRDAHVLEPGEIADTRTYVQRIVPARLLADATFLHHPSLRATFQVMADTVRHLLGRPLPNRQRAA